MNENFFFKFIFFLSLFTRLFSIIIKTEVEHYLINRNILLLHFNIKNYLPFKHGIVQATLGIEIVAGVIEVKAILGVVMVTCVNANELK